MATKDEKESVKQDAPKKKGKFKCCCCGNWELVDHIHRIMVSQRNTPLRYEGIQFKCNADIEVCSKCVRKWKGIITSEDKI